MLVLSLCCFKLLEYATCRSTEQLTLYSMCFAISDSEKNSRRFFGVRDRVFKIVIVLNCNLITFSKVMARNCNSDISKITVIEWNLLQSQNG